MQVLDALDFVQSELGNVPHFKGLVRLVHDEDELIKAAIAGTEVLAGVIYEGVRPSESDSGKSTHRVGVSKELQFSVCVLYRQDKLTQVNVLKNSIKYLDAARQALLDRRGPNNHFFNFREELGGSVEKGLVGVS